MSQGNLHKKLNNNPIIIAGPTGVGKSEFAVELAQRVGGEIVCADAFQLYEGLPVLSAQPGASLQQKAEHHLYGSLPLKTNCDAAYFLRILEPVCRRIQDSGRRPILVGGSGLYIKSFTHGFDPVPPADPMLRKELTGLSLETLKDRLQTADPEAANQIDMQNPRRVIRALEICLTTGLPLSHFRSRWNSEARPHLALLLFREREELHARIECNIDRQFQSGVDKEVADALVNRIGPGARKAIGFESIEKFLKGRISMDECRKSMLLNTRQYAKRQLTWFLRQPRFHLLNLSPPGSQTSCLLTATQLAMESASLSPSP